MYLNNVLLNVYFQSKSPAEHSQLEVPRYNIKGFGGEGCGGEGIRRGIPTIPYPSPAPPPARPPSVMYSRTRAKIGYEHPTLAPYNFNHFLFPSFGDGLGKDPRRNTVGSLEISPVECENIYRNAGTKSPTSQGSQDKNYYNSTPTVFCTLGIFY